MHKYADRPKRDDHLSYAEQHKNHTYIAGSPVYKDATLKRRAAIATLMGAGYTHYEICAKLIEKEILHPTSKKPWSSFVIARDMDDIRRRWYIMSDMPTPEMKADQLGRLRQAQKMCWENGKMADFVRALRLEMELTGTLKPINVNVNMSVDVMMQFNKILEVTGLNGDQLIMAVIDQIRSQQPQLLEMT